MFTIKRCELRKIAAVLVIVSSSILIAACGGGGGSSRGFTVSSAGVPATAANPVSFVNQTSQAAVMVSVAVDGSARARDRLIVSLRDSAGVTVTSTSESIDGAGTISVGPIDVSGQLDGDLELSVQVEDRDGESLGLRAFGVVQKDTIAPAPADSVAVMGPTGGPVTTIFSGIVQQIRGEATRIIGFPADETVVLCFSDGITNIYSPPVQSPGVTTSLMVPPVDLRGLLEGLLTIEVLIGDPAGNIVSSMLSTTLKDTFVARADAALIPSSPDNPLSTVTAVTVNSADVQVDLSPEIVAGDVVTVFVTDSTGAVVQQSSPAPVGGGPLLISGMDLGALVDGPLSLDVRTADIHGNEAVFAGTAASKDTLVGSATLVVVSAGPANPTGFVNSSTALAASVAIDLDAGVSAGDQIHLQITDSGSTTLAFTLTAVDGPGQQIVGPFDLDSLSDGLLQLSVMIEDDVTNLSAPLIGSATKDTVAPAAPLSIVVPLTAMNPAGFVNSNSQNAALFELALPAGTVAGSMVEVGVTGPGGSLTSSFTAMGPGIFTSGGVDLSGLSDGFLTLSGRIGDPAGNFSTATAGTATLDRFVATPSTADIAAGPGNNLGFVSQANVSAATVSLTLPAGSTSSDLIDVNLSLGGSSLPVISTAGLNGGGTRSLAGIDSSSLPDGSGTISGSAVDIAGNTALYGPFSFTKDTNSPPAPSALFVAAGPGHGVNEINLSNVTVVMLDVIWDASSTGLETTTLRLTDSVGTTITAGPYAPLAGGGPATLGSIDLSALVDGPVTIAIDLLEPSGNTTTASGTTANKDTSAPPPPNSAHVAAGAANAQDIVNALSVGAVTVEVSLPPGYTGTEQIVVSLDDGTNPAVVAGPMTAPAGGGLMSFGALDLSLLQEGPLILQVTVTPVSGSPAVTMGTAALKDTLAPTQPSVLRVAGGAMNGADLVNLSNVTATLFNVTWDSSNDGTEIADISIGDGIVSQILAGQATINGGGAATLGSIDVSALADGSLTLSLTLTDTAGNATTFSGTAALKDTVAPLAPSLLRVAAGPGNPQDAINPNNVSGASIDINWNAAMDGTEVATLRFVDSVAGLVSFGPLTPPTGGGTGILGPVDLSALVDGTINLFVDIVDSAGNPASFSGSSAIKDLALPSSPISAEVSAMTGNAADIVNLTNVGALSVTVVLDVGSQASDSLRVMLSDGIVQVSSAPQTGIAGAGTLTFAGIDTTTLADGPLTLDVEVTDANGNVLNFSGDPATKDTVAPALPISAEIAAGLQNPIHFINLLTETSVRSDVSLSASSLASDLVTVTLDDGINSITSASLAGTAGAGTIAFYGLNTATLLEGSITVTVDVVDLAGNPTSFVGTAATKDVTGPDPIISAMVAAGPSNPPLYINSLTQSLVVIDVTLPATYDGSEMVSVILSSGTGPLVVSPVVGAIAGGGLLTMPPLAASSLNDGFVSIFVDLRDSAGNITKFNGTPATKDTVLPAMPSLLRVAAGANNVLDQINAQSMASVSFDVVWDGSNDGSETALLTATDSLGAGITATPVSPLPGGGPGTIGPEDLSALVDGLVTLSLALTDPAGNIATFAGTTATKNSTNPDPPTFAGILAGAGWPVDYINSVNVGGVDIDVTFGPTTDPTDTFVVRLLDGVNTVASSPVASPAGSGTVTITSPDASGLLEGPITVQVEITDIWTNTTVFIGTPAIKDTIAPDLPISALVPSSASNPASFINIATVNGVTVDVTTPATHDGSETVTVRFDDGVNTPVFSSPQSSLLGGGVLAFSGLDTSSLLDGPLMLTVEVTDPAGNISTYNGTPATKDTAAPLVPSSLSVMSGAGNAVGIVNLSNEATTTLDINWDPSMAGDEVATLNLTSSGGGSTVISGITPPAGGGSGTLGPVDLSGLGDGTLSLALAIIDPAGNVSNFTGMAAVKDATAPGPPSSALVVAGAGNSTNVVNSSNETMIQVDVGFPPSADPADTVVIVLSDGVSNVTTTAQNPPTGGGTLVFAGIDGSSLLDGSLTLLVQITDPNGNVAIYPGSSPTKDTQVAAAPSLSRVAATAGNPQDFINSNSEATVSVLVTLPVSYDGSETVTARLADGINPDVLSLPGTAPAGGGNLVLAGIDASSMVEGTITLQVEIIDGSGNTTSYAGMSAVKDVTAPTAPSGLSVAAGGNNAADVINSANVASVVLDVTWDASMAGNESASVDLSSSGGGTITFGPTSVPASGGTGAIGTIDVTALGDGNVTLALSLTDPAGNLTSYVGTMAVKDATGPANPNAATVQAGMSNPINGINGNNETAIIVDVDFGAMTDPTDVYFVTLSDGSTSLSTSTLNAPATAGTISLAPINGSSLVNGLITLTVELTDIYGNTTIFTGTNATKSSNPPDPIISAHVAMTGQNPIDFINSVTQSSVTVEVVTPATYLGTESVTVTLGDGVNAPVVSSAMISPVGMSTISFTGINVSGLNEGTITIDAIVVDGGGNSATTRGSDATKDVTAPLAPSALSVAAGADNAADLVNTLSETAVSLDVTWDASMVGDETATASLIDSLAATISAASVMPPAGGGVGTIGTTDLSSLADGALTVAIDLVDPAGNVTNYTGTAALKDTQGPADPTAANVAVGGNNAVDIINPNNVGSVVLEVALGGSSVNTDQIQVTLDDGVGTVQTTTLSGTTGSGTLTFPGIDASSLAEGTIMVIVELTDANNNLTTYTGTPALKDTIAPTAPSSARVPAGGSNTQDYVNEFTESSATVRVTFPGSYLGTEQATVTVSDGVNPPVVSGSLAVSLGGGTLNFSGLDLSAFPDGPLSITVDVTDGGGNTGTFGGTAATKDTVDPSLLAGRIPRTETHPENHVTRFDDTSLTADVDWAVGADGSETATISFFDGTSTLTSGLMTSTVGAGTVTYAGLDISPLADGVLTMTITAQDVAGNTATVVVPVVKLSAIRDYTRNLYAVNRDDETVSAFLVDANTLQLRANGATPTGTRPVDIAIDAFGQFAYVANETSNDISTYTISSPSGALVAGATAAAGTTPVAIAIDRLARFLYAVNSASNDVSVYAISSGTGALSPGVSVGAGTTPADVQVGPAGKYLLVVNSASNDLMSFAIDQATGALSPAGTLATGTEPTAIAAHPSGDFVYAVNRTAGTITVATLDSGTGALTLVGTTAAGTDPSSLTITADGLYLYVANEGSDDVSMYSVNTTTGALTSLGTVASGTMPSDISASATGNHVFVSHEVGNELRVYSVGGAGSLTEESNALAGIAPVSLAIRSGLNGVGFVLRYAYVGNNGSDDIAMHTVNDATGVLSDLGSPVATGTDPDAVAIHPLGSWLYTANEVSDSLSVFSINGVTGLLTPIGLPIATGGAPKSISITPDGTFLYVINGDTDDISAFVINPTTGVPLSLGATTSTDVEPVSASVTGNGRFLYVVCQGSDTIRSYAIDAATGLLTAAGAALPTGIIPIWVENHPSGRFVYVVNRGTGDVHLYDIDATSGALTFVNSYSTGSQPYAMTIEPSGNYAYVVNRTSQNVAGFSIDQVTGALVSLGAPIAAGADSRAIAVGPRGDFIYATDFASSGTGIVYVYAVNAMTGVLSSIGSHTVNGMGSISLKILADIL